LDPAAGVDQAMVGDRKDPCLELPLVALEPGDISGDLEKHLAQDVLWLRGRAGPQISEHGGREVAVDPRPSRFIAQPRGFEQGLELIRSHPAAEGSERDMAGWTFERISLRP
jgi:hypothetical protein